ncbi:MULTISPECIES: YkgJ family cysteine cluster protein [Burkholderia]|uniref:YkgJ family cysteine cluster protein n=1 Tax=Burkholderia TaxID=32008 RepID=UPI000B79FC70|nr:MULTISPECIES: YkgJ family cysteine cluster protein [Burkholderia]OXI96466.1 zinc/iron-chelating domain-containing protein [Burkholderia sp. AU33803]PRD94224.1 YkgJ family cysteine cluster protein [Burkholderia contaminans]
MNDTPTDLDFACNGCGGCCHDLRIPLTIDEATAWLQRGGHVELLCDAMPWLVEPEPDNGFAAYKRVRSSAALSGSLPVRITVMLTATHAGPCPNLGDDMRCAIYDARPLVCRIYPAEVNPFVPLVPDGKQCTPDAWQQAPFVRGGTIVDAATRENIARSRAASEAETPLRARLCKVLGIDTAAVANEGFAVHAPPAAALLAALTALTAQRASDSAPAGADDTIAWTLVSNRTSTLDALGSVGAASQRAGSANPHASYLGFHPDE